MEKLAAVALTHKVGEGVRFMLLPSMLFYKSFRSELNNNNNKKISLLNPPLIFSIGHRKQKH